MDAIDVVSYFGYILTAWIIVMAIGMAKKDLLQKYGIEIGPLMIMWKKPTSGSKLERIAKKRVVRICAWIGVALSIGAMVFAYYFLINIVLSILFPQTVRAQARLIPLLPGLTVVGVHIFYSMIAIGIAIVAHELSHAVVALSEGIRLKSWGLAIAFIIPAAFVEPDEEDYKKAKLSSKVKLLAAGSAANVIIGVLALFLLQQVASQYPLVIGIIHSVNNQPTPAYLAGLQKYVPFAIESINGTVVDGLATLTSIIHAHANETVNFVLRIFSYNTMSQLDVVLHKPANMSLLGVYINPFPAPKPSLCTLGSACIHIPGLLAWFVWINMGLALINAAPLFITDGGKIISEILGEKRKIISYIIQGATLAILALAFIASILM